MQLRHVRQDMTPIPLEAVAEAIDDGTVLAALPVRDLERGTACLLVAKQGQLWSACRTDAGGSTEPPRVIAESVEWHEVGLGPQGVVGRVPGGLLGGPEAMFHLVTVHAGANRYEAKLAGHEGMEAVEDFVSVARHAGAHDLEP